MNSVQKKKKKINMMFWQHLDQTTNDYFICALLLFFLIPEPPSNGDLEFECKLEDREIISSTSAGAVLSGTHFNTLSHRQWFRFHVP